MRSVPLIAILVSAAPALAAEPAASVTGRKDGKDEVYKDGRDTTAMGLAVAAFGSARLEFPATKERWEAAAKTNHVRVRFATPATLTANTGGGKGKSYAVDEMLVNTTPFAKRPPLPTPNGQGYIAFGDKVDPGLEDSLLIRSGDKYFSFIKYEGMLAVPLITMYGPRSRSERRVGDVEPSAGRHGSPGETCDEAPALLYILSAAGSMAPAGTVRRRAGSTIPRGTRWTGPWGACGRWSASSPFTASLQSLLRRPSVG